MSKLHDPNYQEPLIEKVFSHATSLFKSKQMNKNLRLEVNYSPKKIEIKDLDSGRTFEITIKEVK